MALVLGFCFAFFFCSISDSNSRSLCCCSMPVLVSLNYISIRFRIPFLDSSLCTACASAKLVLLPHRKTSARSNEHVVLA